MRINVDPAVLMWTKITLLYASHLIISAIFGLRFIVLSYRTCQYQHLEGKIMPLAPLFIEICDIKH